MINARLNWILFAAILLLIGANTLIFVTLPRWMSGQYQTKSGPACLKVSDFYSVHLTTYFLAATGHEDMDPEVKSRMYAQYCDRIPGTGRAVFSVDLMEQDARNQAVAISLSHYEPGGQLALVKEVPPAVHPGGVLTLDVAIAKQGKYLLKLAFGEARTKDDVIEMPIIVGQ